MLLPMSTSTVRGATPRKGPPIHGRSSPSIKPRMKTELAIDAPVEPIDTNRSASPLFSNLVATKIEDLGFRRSPSMGCSSSPILPTEATTFTGLFLMS